ncbi:MAG: hypothetical protein Q9165_002396 [Trypethelium subeluteriae]
MPLYTPIVGSLDDDQLHYEAISYCWADQLPTEPVHCDGQTVLATRNCEAALRQFRPENEQETRLLWIDSLCVNQRDTSERSHQVLLMGEIYKKADQVLIWLGNKSVPFEGATLRTPQYYVAAFDWIARIAKAAEEDDVESRRSNFLRLMQESRDMDLFDFVDVVPWFKRLWVVQEAAMSKKAILFYDQGRTSLESIFKAGVFMAELEASGIGGTLALSNPHWNAFGVHNLAKRTLESKSLRNPTDSTVCDFLGEMRWSRCSEAKDKVFALHGLLTASGLPLPPPDYSKSTADIYRETTVAVLKTTYSIRILEQVDGLGSTPGLASWVPDWSSSTHSIGLLGNYYGALAVGDTFFAFPEPDEKKLALSGSSIDVITARCELSLAHTSERLGNSKNYWTWSKNAQPREPFWRDILKANPQHSTTILFFWNFRVLREFVNFALQPTPSAASEDSVLELYNTLMCLCTSHEEVVEDQAGARLWFSTLAGQWVDLPFEETNDQWMDKAIDTVRDDPQLAGIIKTPEYEISKRISIMKTCSTFQQRIERLAYKTLFRTASGKLGIAPHSVRSGDEIMLLAGGRVPMVVRCLGQEYMLVANGHVEGLVACETERTRSCEITFA